MERVEWSAWSGVDWSVWSGVECVERFLEQKLFMYIIRSGSMSRLI